MFNHAYLVGNIMCGCPSSTSSIIAANLKNIGNIGRITLQACKIFEAFSSHSFNMKQCLSLINIPDNTPAKLNYHTNKIVSSSVI